jgi:hypothetical protein
MNRVILVAAVAAASLASACSSNAPDTEAPTGVSASAFSVFTDDFGSSPTSWGMFEEVVGNNTCYGTGIGSVQAVPVTRQQHSDSALRVLANAAASTSSNHVLAQKRLAVDAMAGRRIAQYRMMVMVDPLAGDGLHEGQTGPELSVQSTRVVGSVGYRTATAGIQYIANKWSGQGAWQIWTGPAGGSVAGWATLPATFRLTPGVWYQLTLEADYGSSTYQHLAVSTAGASLNLDLRAYPIVDEIKFTEAALWLTLESENAWSGCGGIYQYGVYYDDVRFDVH